MKIEAAEKRAGDLEKRWQNREAVEQKQREEYILNVHHTTLAKLREKDPGLNDDELISYARQNGIALLDVAYRDMTRDREWAAREKAIREEERVKAEETLKRQQPVLPLRRTIPSTPDANAPQTFDEAAQAAERDPEIQSLMWGQSG